MDSGVTDSDDNDDSDGDNDGSNDDVCDDNCANCDCVIVGKIILEG
jgi:hypothetical protein